MCNTLSPNEHVKLHDFAWEQILIKECYVCDFLLFSQTTSALGEGGQKWLGPIKILVDCLSQIEMRFRCIYKVQVPAQCSLKKNPQCEKYPLSGHPSTHIFAQSRVKLRRRFCTCGYIICCTIIHQRGNGMERS